MFEEIFSGSMLTVVSILIVVAIYLAGRKLVGDLQATAERRED